MPCINKDKLIYLKTYDNVKESIVIPSSIGLFAKQDATYDFFYIQFSMPDSFKHFPISDIVPSNVLEQIKNKKVFLVLDNALEYFLHSVDGIYNDIVFKESIPPEQIIFLTATPNMNEYVRKYSELNNVDQIKVDWFSLFEATGKDACAGSQIACTVKNKTKKFLNLNRRWRLHRPLLLTLLHDKGLLDEGHISFAPSDDGVDWNTAYSQMCRVYANDQNIMPILERNQSIKDLKPMYLDTKDLVTNRAVHEDTINEYYYDSYFSVVNETTYHEGVPFLSEKIFKTIALGHPFILVSVPHSLQYLKQLGYKTYSEIINEDYDTIEDNGLRMIAIANEIERLTKLEGKKLKRWISKTQEIAKYNRSKIIRKQYADLSKPMNYVHHFKAS